MRSADAAFPVLTWTVRSPELLERAARTRRWSDCGRRRKSSTAGGGGGRSRVSIAARVHHNVVARSDAAEWDAACRNRQSFTSHAFLTLLEESGSVGGRSGWSPLPLVIEDEAGAPAARASRLSQDPQPGRICLRSQLG